MRRRSGTPGRQTPSAALRWGWPCTWRIATRCSTARCRRGRKWSDRSSISSMAIDQGRSSIRSATSGPSGPTKRICPRRRSRSGWRSCPRLSAAVEARSAAGLVQLPHLPLRLVEHLRRQSGAVGARVELSQLAAEQRGAGLFDEKVAKLVLRLPKLSLLLQGGGELQARLD